MTADSAVYDVLAGGVLVSEPMTAPAAETEALARGGSARGYCAGQYPLAPVVAAPEREMRPIEPKKPLIRQGNDEGPGLFD